MRCTSSLTQPAGFTKRCRRIEGQRRSCLHAQLRRSPQVVRNATSQRPAGDVPVGGWSLASRSGGPEVTTRRDLPQRWRGGCSPAGSSLGRGSLPTTETPNALRSDHRGLPERSCQRSNPAAITVLPARPRAGHHARGAGHRGARAEDSRHRENGRKTQLWWAALSHRHAEARKFMRQRTNAVRAAWPDETTASCLPLRRAQSWTDPGAGGHSSDAGVCPGL